MQTEKEVAHELFHSIKNDTATVSQIDVNTMYSKQLEDGNVLLADEKFEVLGLSDSLVQVLYSQGLDKPTQIQKTAIPIILSGKDCAFHSTSGTGKTIGFTTGVLGRVERGSGCQAIIITPTRELNLQVSSVVMQLASQLEIGVCCALREYKTDLVNEEVVVGCPAKIINMVNSGAIKKENLKMVVLDEADQMITSRTFGVQTIKLFKELQGIQKIYFSATYSETSQKAVKMLSPNCINHFKENKKAENISLFYIEMDKTKKIEALKSLLELLTVAQAIVFVGSRKMVNIITGVFEKDGFKVSKLHGEVPVEERDSVLTNFAQAKTKILVTTDVFSRGMDIPQVNLIINFDLPSSMYDNSTETYIHRVGRTGRFNRKGFVVDFVASAADFETLLKIQTEIGSTSKKFTIAALTDVLSSSI